MARVIDARCRKASPEAELMEMRYKTQGLLPEGMSRKASPEAELMEIKFALSVSLSMIRRKASPEAELMEIQTTPEYKQGWRTSQSFTRS